jgi:hypothetical protein
MVHPDRRASEDYALRAGELGGDHLDLNRLL